jgi:hypothetical protein
MKRFIEGEDRTQVTLLPACLDDYVEAENPIHVVAEYRLPMPWFALHDMTEQNLRAEYKFYLSVASR